MFVNKTNIFSVKRIVLMAMLVAISIVLTRLASFMLLNGTIRLGFGNLPIIYSGLLLGPIAGGIVGILSDLLGMLIMPAGAYHPGFTLSAALCGIIPGLIVYWMGKSDSWLTVAVSNIVVCIIVFFGLTTLWISQIVGTAFLVLLPSRVIASSIITVISIVVIQILMKRTKHLI